MGPDFSEKNKIKTNKQTKQETMFLHYASDM